MKRDEREREREREREKEREEKKIEVSVRRNNGRKLVTVLDGEREVEGC